LSRLQILIFLLLYSSCSHLDKGKNFKEYDRDSIEKSSLILGLDSNLQKKTYPDISQRDSGYEKAFGPQNLPTDLEKSSVTIEQRKPVIALILGPGLQRVMAYLPLIKELKKNNVPIHVVSGTGLGGVVAYFFSLGLSSNEIEWILFNFWNKSKNMKPFGQIWNKALRSVVFEKFKNRDIQDGKLAFFLPSIKDNGEIDFVKVGKAIDVFAKTLNLSSENVFVFEKAFYEKTYFLRHGVDIVIGLNVLGSAMLLINKDKFLERSFKIFVSQKNDQINNLDLFFEFLEGQKEGIDSLESIPSWEGKAKIWAKNSVKKIKSFVERWENHAQRNGNF
jgi:hypothetical protein